MYRNKHTEGHLDLGKKKTKKKLINRFTFLFRAIQWISIVSGQKVQDQTLYSRPCVTWSMPHSPPFLRPHKLPYSLMLQLHWPSKFFKWA